MTFNISRFKSNIDGYSYLKTNSFEVIITPPSILQNSALNNIGTPTSISDITNNLRFRIDQVRTPAIALQNADIAKYGVGPTQKMPISAAFGDISLSILSDGYGEIWQFWHNWIKTIFDFTSTDSSQVGAANRIATYSAEYKSNYSTTMQIIIYDMYGNAIQRINLFEAFPTSMREVILNWGDVGNLLKLDIDLAYTEYTLSGSSVESILTNSQSSIISSTGASNITITP